MALAARPPNSPSSWPKKCRRSILEGMQLGRVGGTDLQNRAPVEKGRCWVDPKRPFFGASPSRQVAIAETRDQDSTRSHLPTHPGEDCARPHPKRPCTNRRRSCHREGCIYSDRRLDQRVSFEAGLARHGTRGRARKTSRPAGVSGHCTPAGQLLTMRIALRSPTMG
jgi:hypothetical protein